MRDNVRFPVGREGVETLLRMNEEHNEGALWAINLLSMGANSILEVGCGGGRNILNLKDKFPHSIITAIDYSPTSVELSKRTAKKFVDKNEVEIYEKNVIDINFKDKFDLVCAFETIYFWDPILRAFERILASLKEGGKFMIYVESVDKSILKKWSEGTTLKNQLDEDEIVDLLEKVNSSKVEIYRDANRRCFIATK